MPRSGDPVRLSVGTADQVRARRLDPRRLDLRHHARIEALGLDQARRDDPARRALRERRARRDHEARVACSEIGAILVEHADAAQEPRQDRLVQHAARRGDRVAFELLARRDPGQLLVQVLPLARAQEGQEVLLAPAAQRALARRGLLAPPLQRFSTRRNRNARRRTARALGPRPRSCRRPLARVLDAEE
jgi:hypothetical protein